MPKPSLQLQFKRFDHGADLKIAFLLSGQLQCIALLFSERDAAFQGCNFISNRHRSSSIGLAQYQGFDTSSPPKPLPRDGQYCGDGHSAAHSPRVLCAF